MIVLLQDGVGDFIFNNEIINSFYEKIALRKTDTHKIRGNDEGLPAQIAHCINATESSIV